MPTPGANRSTQLPKLEKLARASVWSVAAAVSAVGVEAGDALQALALLFPAETVNTTPAAIAFATAVLRAVESPPPKLMFATAGLIACCRTQSTPAMTPDVVPEPVQSST